jgi:hypothetical protein
MTVFCRTLPVPAVSQLGAGADEHGNDCGPACAIALLRGYRQRGAETLTPDAVYNAIRSQDDKTLGAGELLVYMNQFGLQTDWRANLSVCDIFNQLTNGRPMICLIWYGVLVDARLTKKTKYLEGHFVVAVGIDIEGVAIMDPYRTVDNLQSIPLEIFHKAWTGPNFEVMPIRGALIPSRSIYATTNSSPFGNILLPGTYKTTAYLYIRELPKSNTKLLYQLANGAIVNVEETTEDGRWCYVTTPVGGWVDAKYLKKV